MTETEYRSAEGWLTHPDYKGTIVMDPDGWDRKNYAESWAELISKQEFERRLCISTILRRND